MMTNGMFFQRITVLAVLIGVGVFTATAAQAACTAGFTTDIYYLEVDFTAEYTLDTGDTIDTIEWDFGDSNTGSGEYPSNTYATEDIYTVCITIQTTLGCTDTYCENVTVSAGNCYPSFGKSGTYRDYTFSNYSSWDYGTLAAYTWDFGDGGVSNETSPVYTFPIPGTYNVCLTVETSGGCINDYCQSVTVTAEPGYEYPFNWDGRITSTTHPDPEQWYIYTNFEADWSSLATAHPEAAGYLWCIDSVYNTVVDATNSTFSSTTTLQYDLESWGRWYLHIAAVDGEGTVIEASRAEYRASVSSIDILDRTTHLSKDFDAKLRAGNMSNIYWKIISNTDGWKSRHHSSVVFNNQLWVLGGGGCAYNNVWYSDDGLTWTEATNDAAWSDRYGHTSVIFDNKIWVIGGYDYPSCKNDVWYSEDGINWTEATNDAAWSDRYEHTSVIFDNKIWVIGGYNGSSRLSDVWYSNDGINWNSTTLDAAWSDRYGHTSVVFDNKMWIIGGYGSSGYLNDIWYTDDGISWTKATDNAEWAGRYDHASTVYDDRIWVVGGSSSNDVWSTLDGINWIEHEPLPSDRSQNSCQVFQDNLWVLGGTCSTSNKILEMVLPEVSPFEMLGYHYLIDTVADTVPQDGVDTWSEGNPVDILQTGMAPGGYWLHAMAEDTSGNYSPVLHYGFSIGEASPRITSSTHPDPNQPNGNRDVTLNWSDGGVPGVVNYYYILDTVEDTVPTTASTMTTNQTVTFANVTPGVYWFHVVSEDGYGYISPAGHRRIEIASVATAPPVYSDTHPNPYLNYPEDTVRFLWSDPDDAGTGYYYVFNQQPSTIPTTSDTWTTSTSLTKYSVAEGAWFFHIRSVDTYGNLSAIGRLRVNVISGAPVAPELCEALDNCGLTWTTGGGDIWTSQVEVNHDGMHSGQSGQDLYDYEESWLQTTVYGPGTLSFYWKFYDPSSAEFYFRIDSSTQSNLYSTTDWQFKEYVITPGTHTLRWRVYNYNYDNQPAGWLDQVVWTPDNWDSLGYHPSDTDTNFRIEADEVTNYGAAWKTGATWPTGPSSIPIGYVTRSGYIWKQGEYYLYDGSYPTFCWQLTSKDASPAAAGTAFRTIIDREVILEVLPDVKTTVYAVEETLPPGVVPTAIQGGGLFDAASNSIKWGPFFNAIPQTLGYTLETVPDGLVGQASFDGIDVIVENKNTEAPLTETNDEEDSEVNEDDADENIESDTTDVEEDDEVTDDNEESDGSNNEADVVEDENLENEEDSLNNDENEDSEGCRQGCSVLDEGKRFGDWLTSWLLLGLAMIGLAAMSVVRGK